VYNCGTALDCVVEGVGDGKVAPGEEVEVRVGGGIEGAEEEGFFEIAGCGVDFVAFGQEDGDYAGG